MTRPAALVVVVGTVTEVGKTWVTCQLLEHLRSAGCLVAARKPAQSFAAADFDDGRPTDADLLAAASGEHPTDVCPEERWYPAAMAPPMAADRLDRPPIRVADLLDELRWPDHIDVGLVEAAGGVRSPIAHDADGADLARQLAPDLVVLVADARLGAINAVRSGIDALLPLPAVVVLNRYDPGDQLHLANRTWLAEQDRLDVVTDLRTLIARLTQPGHATPGK